MKVVPERHPRERFLLALTCAVLAGVAAAPHIVSPTGHDTFRFPKELWVRGEGIVFAVLLILGFLWGWIDTGVFKRERGVFALVAGIVAWTGIATIFSTYPGQSVWSLFYVTSGAVIFVATVIAALRRSLLFADIALLAAVPNAILCVLGELRIWHPFLTEKEMLASGEWMHLYAGGLLGNPNDMGSFLVAPTLASMILCATIKHRRAWYGVLAVIITVGLLVAQSIAAIGALVVALVFIVFRVSRKIAVAIVIAIVVIGSLVSAFSFSAQRKIRGTIQVIRAKQVTAYMIDEAISNRLLPFLVAAQMGVDHPLTGVGPGRFSWHFYEYKLRCETRHPTLRKSVTNYLNWGEVHNDHLQTLATTGFPGYALYITAIVLLARRSRRPHDRDELALVAHRLALPLAVMFFVLTLAQFPMEIGAATTMLLHWAALCVAWSSDAAA
ncbi:MAG TPA: O-antigen ligase family protein [Thermoanaerobaculia bacterium]|nr:O-antigen ligase family protein [Thermoanaerobaculia bacterium]